MTVMASFRLTRWRADGARDAARDRSDAWLDLATELATGVAREVVPVRTGRLQRSISRTPPRGDAGRRRAGVRASAPYALWVEIGTPRSGARPYLRPAARRVVDETPSILRQAGAAQGGGRS